jgi:hypothetical protein
LKEFGQKVAEILPFNSSFEFDPNLEFLDREVDSDFNLLFNIRQQSVDQVMEVVIIQSTVTLKHHLLQQLSHTFTGNSLLIRGAYVSVTVDEHELRVILQ